MSRQGSKSRGVSWVVMVSLTLASAAVQARDDRPSAGGSPAAVEPVVAAALEWLARHQAEDGRWSVADFNKRCQGDQCTGSGQIASDAAATGLAILAFQGAGYTHAVKNPYQKNLRLGVGWLMQEQKADGCLSADKAAMMYGHGMATLALAECYGLTKDKQVGMVAQKAVEFIEAAQHPRTGGWRYQPGQEGDTSVFGWQFSALKSAAAAGLAVKPPTFDRAKLWLKAAAQGEESGRFCYIPMGAPTPCMTAVGLRCTMLSPFKREDAPIVDGLSLLKQNPPGTGSSNGYYWYYASQVMDAAGGSEARDWGQKLRNTLTESQSKHGCAAGSWDPAQPLRDQWGQPGGRLIVTCLYTLALEAPYRHLTVFGRGAKPKD